MVGTTNTGEAAPYNDLSWEIWGVSCRRPYVTRATRWFELHRLDGEPEQWANAWRDEIRKFSTDVELWMMYPENLGPNVIQYPYESIVARFGTYFMTSTFSWMMAKAIDELRPMKDGKIDFSEQGHISIFGVEMEYGSEYCIGPETKVLTSALRWVQADSLVDGDELVAFDENSTKENRRRWRKAKVLSTNRIKRPCYKLFMEDGTELISSAEHRWLVWSEHEFRWQRTDQMITPMHRNPTKICKPLNTWEMLDTRDAGYIAAAIDGEGHLDQGSPGRRLGDLRVGFSQRDNAMAEEFLKVTTNLGYNFSGCKDKTGCVKYTLCGTRNSNIEFLGKIRPPRLMSKFDASKLGAIQNMNNAMAVERIEYLGEQTVIALGTSTGTFIAEGFASHNSQQRSGFRHYIDLARFLGIPVTRIASGGLAYEPVPYPMWQDDPLIAKLDLRLATTKKTLDQRDNTRITTQRLIGECNRLLEELEIVSKGNGYDVQKRIAEVEKERKNLLQTSAELSCEIVQNRGAYEELSWMRSFLEP